MNVWGTQKDRSKNKETDENNQDLIPESDIDYTY